MFYYYDIINNRIFETEEDWCPIGDGYMIDMNNIQYSDYVKAPENYIVEQGKVFIK